MSFLPELVSRGELSLTAAVSLCCRWEREINNLSMEIWLSKYGQGLFSPLPFHLILIFVLEVKHRRHCSVYSVSFLPYIAPILMLPREAPFQNTVACLFSFKPEFLYVVCGFFFFFFFFCSLITPSLNFKTSSVIHRWGFKFRMWTNHCTAERFTASNQSYAKSRGLVCTKESALQWWAWPSSMPSFLESRVTPCANWAVIRL